MNQEIGPWILRLRCMKRILDYLVPTEQISYCDALLLPPPKLEIIETSTEKYYRIGDFNHGQYEERDSQGNLKSECVFRNGYPHGLYLSYKNGQLRSKCSFNNGLTDGEYVAWNSDGLVVEHCYYKNGEREPYH